MKKSLRPDDAKIGGRAIELLTGLHGAAPGRTTADSAELGPLEVELPDLLPEPAPGRTGAWNDRALFSLLQDKSLFPSVKEISAFLPASVAAKHKESRERYVQRVMKHVMTLSDSEKREFRERLGKFVSRKPAGFVSQWKSLIKAL
ncbi:hypothetical protein [Luteibacter sp. UNCMF331Sha3.1]|uniref:hypothetical protein n=1 Tax=Luteibacter sp. UNCMF331Sha3.1 TaxID=1502760 RepID=UPI0011137CDE|nr:hypothetical protein [Luteibacter sp. UNCMF331Sha3.1]